MIDLTAHKQFFAKTTALANELQNIEAQVKEEEQLLFKQMQLITGAINKSANVELKKNTAISNIIATQLEQTSQVLSAWEKKIQSYEKGLSFRDKFGDSLLIFVYGKVKAGKSSLGNYIATGKSNPDAEWMKEVSNTLHEPKFFVEAKNEKYKENNNYDEGFQVGAAETTATIQGFTVPGLTWVDSPGLHSVNIENGDLTKQYVDSADLIVYPMNSAQPGRDSDTKELKTLLQSGKRTLALITRSDTTEQDVDEETGELINELAMKSDKDRQDQEEYVENTLLELASELKIQDPDTSALTVSIHYAEENGNSPKAMEDSGMAKFLEKLSTTIETEGIELKKQAPYRNLQAFYQELLRPESELSIHRVKDPLTKALDSIAQKETELHLLTERVNNTILLEYSTHVDSLVEEAAQNKSTQDINKNLESFLNQQIKDHYYEELKELCETTVSILASIPMEMGFKDEIQFEDSYTTIAIDVSGKSKAIGSGGGALLGGIIGFFVAGPAGAAIGSMAGGTIGNVAGKAISSTEDYKFKTGDNRNQIKNTLQLKGEQAIKKALNSIKEEVIEDVFTPIKVAIFTIDDQIENFQKYIKGQISHV